MSTPAPGFGRVSTGANVVIDQNNYIFPTDICNVCKKGELIPIEYEGILVCNNCSSNTKFLIENERELVWGNLISA